MQIVRKIGKKGARWKAMKIHARARIRRHEGYEQMLGRNGMGR